MPVKNIKFKLIMFKQLLSKGFMTLRSDVLLVRVEQCSWWVWKSKTSFSPTKCKKKQVNKTMVFLCTYPEGLYFIFEL